MLLFLFLSRLSPCPHRLQTTPQTTHRRESVCVTGISGNSPGLELLCVSLTRLQVGDGAGGDPRAGRRGGEEGEHGDGGEEEGAEGEHSGCCCCFFG